MLSNMLKHKTAMLMVSKKKSTSAFSNAQLVIAKTKRYNKNIIGDGILVHSREDTLSKFINPISKNCEWVFDGIIYQKVKILKIASSCFYKARKSNIT